MTVAPAAPISRRAPGVVREAAALAGRIPLHAVVLGLTLLWLAPTVGLIVNSFRPARLVASAGWWTALVPPLRLTLENYVAVLHTYNMGRSFANSLMISIPATIMPITIAACAAYALAWMRFRGRGVLFVLVVAALVVPLQATLVPVFRLLSGLGLVGTFPAAWLAHTGYGLPFAIYLLRNFMATLPRDLMEAAAIDGASPLGIFVRIVVPLSVPALAALAIFQFLWVWNDLLVALVFVGGTPAVAPMTVSVSNLASSLGQDWQLLTAAAWLSMLLPVVVFFALQRFFVRGILAGALKG